MWKQISEEQFYVLGELGIVCFFWPKNPEVDTVSSGMHIDYFEAHKPYFSFDVEKREASYAHPDRCTYWTEVESNGSCDSSSDNCDEVLSDV